MVWTKYHRASNSKTLERFRYWKEISRPEGVKVNRKRYESCRDEEIERDKGVFGSLKADPR